MELISQNCAGERAHKDKEYKGAAKCNGAYKLDIHRPLNSAS